MTRYASGEVPAVGDTVECVDDVPSLAGEREVTCVDKNGW